MEKTVAKHKSLSWKQRWTNHWYILMPVLFVLLIVEAILQNNAYFYLYDKHRGLANFDYAIAPFILVMLIFTFFGFIATAVRRSSYKRGSKANSLPFTHKVSDVIVMVGAVFFIVSSIMVGAMYASAKHSDGNCISVEQSWHEVGHHKCVTFHAGYVYTSWQHNTFIDQTSNYSQGFSVYVPNGSGLSSETAHSYLNKTIDVTGTITSYRGAPQIMVSDPSQIKLR